MKANPKRPSRLRAEIDEMAKAQYESGTLDEEAYRKITMPSPDRIEETTSAPLTDEETCDLRDRPDACQRDPGFCVSG